MVVDEDVFSPDIAKVSSISVPNTETAFDAIKIALGSGLPSGTSKMGAMTYHIF